MNNIIRPLFTSFIFLTLVTGVGYPLLVTAIGQKFFPYQANGSLIERQGKVIGSQLIGQSFTEPQYFWGRLSATSPTPYNSGLSGGSNLGPLNPALLQNAQARLDALHAADPGNQAAVPIDLVTSSASGLDPEISLAAVEYQLKRVANSRHLSEARLRALVNAQVQHPWLGFVGETRANVLTLNLALDAMIHP
ncbi:potassium-transporting ATPase subunit KdpC [Candidatus Methylospira mobilis]|uniref:potassium-transporting ATPase subunit KdpC n=1 Tax=Candidatus Methylospira mobilis TaxID=1808979 RepID=UPI0028E3F71C|nr:potassium-transporting ATPase subunit KdpC [Candidatus Methylospira mobilis]WNV06180.1 potassium-transporting ATPase subunit KdpC [Candidatus Methylospira mobilis]